MTQKSFEVLNWKYTDSHISSSVLLFYFPSQNWATPHDWSYSFFFFFGCNQEPGQVGICFGVETGLQAYDCKGIFNTHLLLVKQICFKVVLDLRSTLTTGHLY